MTTNPNGIARLSRAVRNRRTELRMTQDDVASAGGPSDVTVRNIELGKVTRINVATLAKLDEALQWEPGTAAGHLSNEGPAVATRAPRSVYLHEASDADLLLEVSRRMSEQRIRHDRPADQPQPHADDAPVARGPQPDGATTRTSEPRLTLLSDDAPDLRGLPFAADEEKPGDDPGEDDD